MARGWESKSIADQIEEGKAQPLPSSSETALERQKQARLESLRLSRSRLLQQLEKARHPAHREMLMKGLSAVEKELEAAMAEAPED